MCTTIVPTTELRPGDVLVDSATNDPEHPLITDVIVGVFVFDPPAVTATVLCMRHAYGRVELTHWYSGIDAAHCVIARKDEDGNLGLATATPRYVQREDV